VIPRSSMTGVIELHCWLASFKSCARVISPGSPDGAEFTSTLTLWGTPTTDYQSAIRNPHPAIQKL
jgi:hypothetical protein